MDTVPDNAVPDNATSDMSAESGGGMPRRGRDHRSGQRTDATCACDRRPGRPSRPR
ncbi:hypothetical protein FAIPA1_50248 [Frankia sp. AiPs1]